MALTGNLPFSPSTAPLGAHGAPTCKHETASVLLRRADNLGRPRAFINGGKIQDESGKFVTPETPGDSEKASSQAEVRFTQVVTGNARWHPTEEAEGEHLIGFDTISEKLRFAPAQPFDEGVELTVIQGERKATAVHLPPPVTINLRDAEPASEGLLTDEQLDYFRANGKNALIFIHGYNVTHGEWGKLGWHSQKATVWQDPQTINDAYLNGTGAHNWANHMEYRLNRAAGFDGENWMPYSRIIAISWPGDTGSTDFMQAELNAMTAGRRLIPLLLQLADADIAINLISHSLGARVALTALNIAGTLGRSNLIDHLFLWQPAVADNALSNDSNRDVHPLGLGVFPVAHNAARKIVVLHSRGDGILGPDNDGDSSWWERALSRFSPVVSAARDLATADDFMDEALGKLQGAYDKKWWTFPSCLENGFGPAIEKLYKDYLPLTFDAWMTAHPQRSLTTATELKQTVKNNWARLEKDILAEATALRQPCIDCLRNGERPPDYTLLAPLNHRASVSPQVAKDYVLRLKKLALNHWVPEHPPRPALGYLGFGDVAGENATELDEFIDRSLTDERFSSVDQSGWLFSHSGMRIPSQEVFKKSFTDEIMEPILKEGVGFGRY